MAESRAEAKYESDLEAALQQSAREAEAFARAEAALDARLKLLFLERRRVPKDGNCQFEAARFGLGVKGNIRKKVVAHIRRQRLSVCVLFKLIEGQLAV